MAVISDLHLGTYGCHAKQLLQYLKSIDPDVLVLNGDIIDIWNFSKNYFPKSHMHVLRQILKMAEHGTKTYYITGNHDEALRKYSGIQLGNFILDDKVILKLNGKKVWFFHGDIFDATTKGWARIIAKLGGKGYDILIWTNRLINDILNYFGKEKVSLSKKVKSGVKKAVKWITNFEDIAASLALRVNSCNSWLKKTVMNLGNQRMGANPCHLRLKMGRNGRFIPTFAKMLGFTRMG